MRDDPAPQVMEPRANDRTIQVVVASGGAWDAPQTRTRIGPLREDPRYRVVALSAATFPSDEQIDALLAESDRSEASTLILQRILPSDGQLGRLRSAYQRIVFDIDDAIYAVPPDLGAPRLTRAGKALGRVLLRGSSTASARRRPLARVLGEVDVCVVGNAVLGEFAAPYCRDLVEIPTTVPLPTEGATPPDSPVVVWTGMADNLQYLELVAPALERLGGELIFTVRIVSSEPWHEAPVATEFIPWSEAAERKALSGSSVGIAPLADNEWTRGKCAYRAILYGGHGLPCVASPVGITDRVVLDRETGFLARDMDEWLDSLRSLLTGRERGVEMGAQARRHVAANYTDAIALDRWSAFLTDPA